VKTGAWGMHIIPYKSNEVMKLSILDLNCRESVSLPKEGCNLCGCEESLLLGGNYQIYLSFELPPDYYLKNLKQAKLVLYKLPMIVQSEGSSDYEIYPLLNFFSAFSGVFEPPAVDEERKETFTDQESCAYSEADITNIVKAFLGEKVENKGLLLTGSEETRIITYASDRYERRGMRPMLRLIYEDMICIPLSCVPCKSSIED